MGRCGSCKIRVVLLKSLVAKRKLRWMGREQSWGTCDVAVVKKLERKTGRALTGPWEILRRQNLDDLGAAWSRD